MDFWGGCQIKHDYGDLCKGRILNVIFISLYLALFSFIVSDCCNWGLINGSEDTDMASRRGEARRVWDILETIEARIG
jgi:hypothetical protein